jgi:hypothetical protein
MARKRGIVWSPFGSFSTKRGAQAAARNYQLKNPLIRKTARKDRKGRVYSYDFKLFDRNM